MAANKSIRGIKRKTTASTESTLPEKKAKSEILKKNIQPSGKSGGGGSVNVPGTKRVETATFKEHENEEIDLTKDHLRIFLSNLDYRYKTQRVFSKN